MNWLKNLKGRIKFGEYLKNHTTFKIGGPAEIFFEPRDTEDLKRFLSLIRKHKLPFRILGAGSNILVRDGGLKGAVIKLNAPNFKKISFAQGYVEAGSGVLLKELISSCQKKGFSSLEFLSGIPATIGGAVMMNSGVGGRDISESLERLTVLGLNGKLKNLKAREVRFGYRSTNLGKLTILSCRFKLVKKNKDEIKNSIKKYLAYRIKTQDYSYPSAGCVFKNPESDFAGRLIDLCGLKGKGIGGARISLKHANFILNNKNAKARDVLMLMDLIEKKVGDRFKIRLDPEIKIW